MEMVLKFLKYIWIFSLTCLLNQVLKAEDQQKLNQLKTQIHSVQLMNLSFYSNKIYYGEFKVYANNLGEVKSIEKKSYQQMMALFLVKEKYEEFKQQFSNIDLLSAKQISDFGIDQVIDMNNFKADVKAPLIFLNPNRISLSISQDDQSEINLYPAKYSAFMNYSFNEKLAEEKIPSPIKQSTLTGSLDPVVNINNTILESHHLLKSDGKWSRSGTKASRDLVNRQLRISAGDLNYIPKIFQTGYDYLGISITRSFDITPGSTVTSTGEKEIYLETPSLVQVFINGFLVQSLALEAGKHILEDIPLSQGINYISVKITDSSGSVRYIVFQSTGSESMLKRGVQEFSYDLGSFSTNLNNKIEYKKEPIFSFYHRYGITNSYTAGVNSQIKDGKTILGLENLYGARVGLLIHNLSFSQNESSDSGVASRINYIWTKPNENFNHAQRLTLAYEYQSPHYLNNLITKTLALNSFRHTLQFIYDQNISDTLSGLIQGSFSSINFKNLTYTQYNIGMNYKVKNNLFSSLYWTTTNNLSTNPMTKNQTILAQLTYFFDDGKKNLITSFNQNDHINNFQTEYSYNENRINNNTIYRARAASSSLENSANLSHYHNWSMGELTTSFDYRSANKRSEINLTPTGSLSFADGKFALGPRINQSFVIVENNFKEKVIINGDQDNHEASLKEGERAVITSLQPYVVKRLSVISDENKNSDFSNNEYLTMAYNKTGALLSLSKTANKIIEGVLSDELGKPYAMVGAKLINLSSGEETLFFTNREGGFVVENIKEDNYQIIVIDHSQLRSTSINLSSKLKEERNSLGKIIIKRN